MKKLVLFGASAAFILAACGDENTTNVTEIVGPKTLAKGEALDDYGCNKDNIGEFIFVTDSAEAYYCDGDDWQSMKGKDGSSCTAKKNSNGDFDLTCDGKKVGTIENGKNGDKGDDGTSCTAKKNSNGDFDLTCDGKSVGTIKNGKNGGKGDDGTSCTAEKNSSGDFDLTCDGKKVGTIKNGEKGEGCKVKEGENGVVTVICGEGDAATTSTLYKAMCGGKPYNPEELTCIGDELLKPCGDGFYKETEQYCQSGKVVDAVCSGKTFNPLEQYCHNGVVEDNPTCKGVPYLAVTQYCKNGKEVADYGYWVKGNYTYKTVVIGEGDDAQTWMAENLRGGKCGGGDTESGNEGNCSIYGGLVDWSAAVSNLCNEKEGWFLPEKSDFEKLISNVGGKDQAGMVLKASNIWEVGNAGNDTYGFNAVPAGYYHWDDLVSANREYRHDGNKYADFWTHTKVDPSKNTEAYYMKLTSTNGNDMDDKAEIEKMGLEHYLSVRCIYKGIPVAGND